MVSCETEIRDNVPKQVMNDLRSERWEDRGGWSLWAAELPSAKSVDRPLGEDAKPNAQVL